MTPKEKREREDSRSRDVRDMTKNTSEQEQIIKSTIPGRRRRGKLWDSIMRDLRGTRSQLT